jgi:uncharacterized membrane protein
VDERTTPPRAWRTSPHRLFGLADGVFAISMTLLALDVRIADDLPDDSAGFHHGAADFYYQYGIFAVAFAITGRFWIANHAMLARLEHVDRGLLERVVPFLFGICSLPVATSLLVRFGSTPEAVSVAAGLLAVTSLLSARIWWYISDPARDLSDENDPVTRLDRLLGSLWNALVFVAAIPLAHLLPHAGWLPHRFQSSAWATLIWITLLLDDRFVTLITHRRRR